MADPISSPVKMLVSIVDRGRGSGLAAYYNKKYPHTSFLAMGVGTASTAIMDMLGLESADKDVIFSFVNAQYLSDMLNEISGRKLMKFSGRGIAFTMRLTGISSLLHAALMRSGDIPISPLQGEAEPQSGKEQTMVPDNAYSLILAVSEPGYTEQIMEAARDAGATGGTVLHARGVGHGAAEHFLSLTIQPEKEIISILTPSEKRIPIMRAINENFGLRSDAKAMILSLPVEDLVQVH